MLNSVDNYNLMISLYVVLTKKSFHCKENIKKCYHLVKQVLIA